MPTCTYNPLFKHVKRENLEVGKIYVCGDETYTPSSCWARGPMKIQKLNGNNTVNRMSTLDESCTKDCSCSDLDHLYLYEETLMYTHPLLNVKGGELITDGTYFRRLLSPVMNKELGELATIATSCSSKEETSDFLKKQATGFTLYELTDWSIVDETEKPKPTLDEILAKLTPEEQEVIKGLK